MVGKRVPPSTSDIVNYMLGAVGGASSLGVGYQFLKKPIKGLINRFRKDPTGRIALMTALRTGVSTQYSIMTSINYFQNFQSLAEKEFRKRNDGRKPRVMDRAAIDSITAELQQTAENLQASDNGQPESATTGQPPAPLQRVRIQM